MGSTKEACGVRADTEPYNFVAGQAGQAGRVIARHEPSRTPRGLHINKGRSRTAGTTSHLPVSHPRRFRTVAHLGPDLGCKRWLVLQFAHQRGSLKFRRDLSAQHNPQQSSDPQWGMPTSLDINSKSPLQYNNTAVKNLSPSTARGDPTAPSSMLPSGPTCGQQPASNARNDQNNCFHATLLSLLSAVSFTYENAK